MLLIVVLMFFRVTLCRFAIAANKTSAQEMQNTLNLSDWMGNLPKKLTILPLTQLAIPGTHDSGAYDLDVSLPIAKDQSPFVKHFGKTVNCGKLIIKNWSETQKLTITQQLMSGVRYLDMRVAYLKEEDDFRFVHGLHGSKLTTLLEEVRIFIKSHPKEVIFIEFKNFIGLTKTLHGRFASIILSKFSGEIQPWFHGNNVTLSKMWATGKRLIIIYKDIAKIPFDTIFYQPSQVSSDWANTDSADALLKALGNQYEKRNSSIINVYQAVLAPQAITIIENPLGSLEEDLARKANIKVRKWLKIMYYQNLTGLNIIILDYVDYGNCIEQILKLNSLLSNF